LDLPRLPLFVFPHRRNSTFALVRRDDDWLIAKETPD
jgi:hypothetical protein